MRSITRLFGAFGTLADSILSLAGVVDVAAGRLRQQLAQETEARVLLEQTQDDAPALTNGRRAKARAGG